MFGSRGKVNKSSSVSIRQEHCLKSYWQDGNMTSKHQVPVCVYRSSMKHINILSKFDGNEPPPVESDGTLAAQMHLLRPCGQGVKGFSNRLCALRIAGRTGHYVQNCSVLCWHIWTTSGTSSADFKSTKGPFKTLLATMLQYS